MRILFLGILVVAAGLPAYAQSTPIRIAGVQEPPELTGKPKEVKKPTGTQRQFGEMIPELTDGAKAKSARPKLDMFLVQHPDYSDGYFMRAMCDLCTLESQEYASILRDVEKAIFSTHPSSKIETIYEKLTDHYSLRGKLQLLLGRHREALDDLEAAMKISFDSADRIFNTGEVEPEKTSTLCAWNLADLDTLVTKLPTDYRTVLFRGLYFKFFTTFNEKYYAVAEQNFQKAALLNPTSPLPHYFIGELHTKASFWTKAAWASEEGPNEPHRKAILAYNKAIQLDPRFRRAYEMRASTYHGLKQYAQAIRDYDKVLELDAENAIAYADRGLAKMELGQDFAATVDLGEAIRRKKDDDSTLWNSYEHRGDAYMKIDMYKDAIDDYGRAIERQLANLTFQLNLRQIRGLYPEYNGVPDEALCRGDPTPRGSLRPLPLTHGQVERGTIVVASDIERVPEDQKTIPDVDAKA